MRHVREAAPSPAFFKLIGYTPYPYQERIHDSWSLYRIAIIGRQSGKSEIAAVEAAFEVLMRPGSRGWVVAPTYEQATFVFERVVEYVKRGMSVIPGNRNIRIMSNRNLKMVVDHFDANGKFLGSSHFQGKSAENPDNLRGASLDYVIIDEAAMVDEQVWFASLAPTLSTTNGWVLIITTPKGFNWVHELYRRAEEHRDDPKYPRYTPYAAWQLPTWDANPKVSPEFFAQQKAMQPERVYRQEFGAEFIADSGSVFQGLDELPKGRVLRRDDIELVVRPSSIGNSYVIGADFARLDDFSVFTVVNLTRRTVDKVVRLNTVAWERQLERLKALCTEYPNSFIAADVQGLGDVLQEQLASMQLPLEGLAFKTTSIKEACINKLALAIEHRRVELPDDKDYLAEFRDFIYEKTLTGQLKMRAAGRGKDDRVVSLAMAWHFVPEHGAAMLDLPDDAMSVELYDSEFAAVDELGSIFR